MSLAGGQPQRNRGWWERIILNPFLNRINNARCSDSATKGLKLGPVRTIFSPYPILGPQCGETEPSTGNRTTVTYATAARSGSHRKNAVRRIETAITTRTDPYFQQDPV